MSIHGIWGFNYNSKGWTSNEHGVAQLQRCFGLKTLEKVNRKYCLLICNRSDSHITTEYIAHYIDNNILLMILPLHSLHLTQPLDVRVFGALELDNTPRVKGGKWLQKQAGWLCSLVISLQKVRKFSIGPELDNPNYRPGLFMW